MMKIVKKVFAVLSGLLLLWFVVGYFSAFYLVSSNQKIINKISFLENYPIEYLSIKTEDSVEVQASWIARERKKCVIILSGVRGNRTNCYEHAKLYLGKGYSVLLPDLRGTGETKGNISFGWNEQKDLKACARFLENKGKNIATHGMSLGAATIIYSSQSINYDFIVLESSYDNIHHAFYNRLEKLHLPTICYFPVEFFIAQMMKVSLDELSPEEKIKNIKCPVLYFAGDNEGVIKNEETRLIFKNIQSEDKQLYFFEGAKHEDFYKNYPIKYKRVWEEFINKR
ncbi:MAG: alpha/beta hydrolase [Cytophagales bacterium]|nr:alpha/beta hydrolase [Cytophagales bacterium]